MQEASRTPQDRETTWDETEVFVPGGQSSQTNERSPFQRSLRARAAKLSRRFPLTIDAYRLLRQPRTEYESWHDYVTTRRKLGFLRAATPKGPSRGTALFVMLHDAAISDAKLQMVLATALRLRGWRTVGLVRAKSSTRAIRYCHAFGVDEIAYYEDTTLDPEERAQCREAADRLLAPELTFPDVKKWRFHDSAVGAHLLSTVSRVTLQGAPDPQQPEIREEIEGLTPKVLEWVVRAEKLLDQLHPDALFVMEANYAMIGPLVDTAVVRGVDVVQSTSAWRDDALMCKRLTKETRRVQNISIEEANLRRLAAHPWGAAEEAALEEEFRKRYGDVWVLSSRYQPGTERKSREQLVHELALDPEKKIAVVFSHLLWDGNLFFGEDLFDNYGVWLVETVRAAAANPSVSWLIKMHPINVFARATYGDDSVQYEVELIRRAIGDLPDHVRLLRPDTDVSSFSLYNIADYGITVRGTPGMEMACFGKTILTAGTGRYDHMGFTVDSETIDEYLERLARIEDQPVPSNEQIILAKWHALATFRLRQFVLESFTPTFDFRSSGYHPLERNVQVNVSSLADITKFGDLDAFADFAEDTSQVDFLQDLGRETAAS